MRATPPALIAWLQARRPTIIVDLFNFIFTDGSQLNVCTYSNNITYAGITYTSVAKPVITRTGWEMKNTPEVPTMDVTILSNGLDFGGVNIKSAVINGLLDGAQMNLRRVFLHPQTEAQIGGVDVFFGITGPVTVALTSVKITFRGKNVRMDQNYPKNIYQAGCIWSLYGSGCLVSRSKFTFDGSVSVATDNLHVKWSADPTGGNYANLGLGYINFLTGDCAGNTRSIQAVSSTGVSLIYPLDAIPQSGDTFQVAYGCRKTLYYCTTVFKNNQRWRGFPYVPPPETAV